jgi:YidC/Oxa1 family membrane protein insertase
VNDLWNGFRDLFITGLEWLHTVLSAVFGDETAWGWSIIALTVVVRVILLPLAIKQTRSMRAMQALQPKIKAIQKKYKADRELLRKDPEQYKAKRAKMNEELTALYQESGVNPASGCLPLIAQAPIFIALFSILRSNPDMVEPGSTLNRMLNADFYFFTPGEHGLSTAASAAGVAGITLIVLMAGTMFWSQKQMMAKNAANADPAQLQQQRIMLYVMPAFLAFISFNFPIGVLLYWVTTNFWQVGQQAVILYEVEHDPGAEAVEADPVTDKKKSPKAKPTPPAKAPPPKKKPSGKSDSATRKPSGGKRDHLPQRRPKGGRS